MLSHSTSESSTCYSRGAYGPRRLDKNTDWETRERVRQWLRFLLETRFHGNAAAFARHIGLTQSNQITKAISPKEGPIGLDLVVRVHRKCDITMDRLVDYYPTAEAEREATKRGPPDPTFASGANAIPRRRRKAGG